jgi:hypothetical protein
MAGELLGPISCGSAAEPHASGPAHHFSVQSFGAKGDGQADDTAALNACVAAAGVEGGIVDFAPGTYRLRRRPNGGQGPAIALHSGVSIDGHGCTLLLDDNCSYIGTVIDQTARAHIDCDAAAGDNTIHVDSTEAFRAGDPVGLRLGDNAWDAHETRLMFFTSVRAVVDPNHLRLADDLPQSLDVQNTKSQNRALLRFRPADNPIYCDAFIRNLVLQRTPAPRGNPEAGIDLRYARDVGIDNITATDPGNGVVKLAYCRRITVRHVSCDRSIAINGHSAKGRVLNVWNSSDCVFDDFEAHAFAGPVAFIESYCSNLRCTNWRIVNDWSQQMGSPRPFKVLLMIVQGSEAVFEHLNISGDGSGEMITDSGGAPAKIAIRGISIAVSGKFKGFNVGQVSTGPINLNGHAFGPLQERVIQVELQAGQRYGKPLNLRPFGLCHRVMVKAQGLRLKQHFNINGRAVDLTLENPSTEVWMLAKMGAIYPGNPSESGSLTFDTSALTEKLSVAITLNYFPELAATE